MMKDITLYTEAQLNRVSGMWLVKSTELQWKVNKMKTRLEKRLAREAKRHASLEPTQKLLSTAKIVFDALLPHGESEALELVRAQIVECEAKIKSATDRYNLMHEAEIALKHMDIEVLQLHVDHAKSAMAEVEAELTKRIEATVVEEAVVFKEITSPQPESADTDKKKSIELGILRALRRPPNTFFRLKGNLQKLERQRGVQLPERLLAMQHVATNFTRGNGHRTAKTNGFESQ